MCVLNHRGLWAGGEGKDTGGIVEEESKHIIRKNVNLHSTASGEPYVALIQMIFRKDR